ncbi:MAG: pilus assembly protein TadG-related protein [Pirellulales bacterium]|nr:pilus assembly protein TadG-related protein [Pirellulales bacterium]
MLLERLHKHRRRAATLVLTAVMMIVLLSMVALSIDCGYVVLVRTQLQNAADSAALAASFEIGRPLADAVAKAQEYGAFHNAAGRSVQIGGSDVEFGIWDHDARTFVPTGSTANAVRVTARCDSSTGGEAGLFFARIFGRNSVALQASAVASAMPRDIAFVVDLSGSMNDDAEPAWATSLVNATYGGVGNAVMQKMFTDLNFGSYPGTLQYVGAPLGVSANQYAYAQMTSNNGPLANPAMNGYYRINPNDSEALRRTKAYRWIIDNQLAVIMPNATPTPNSNSNFQYWSAYLDYMIWAVWIDEPDPNAPPPPPPPPPRRRIPTRNPSRIQIPTPIQSPSRIRIHPPLRPPRLRPPRRRDPIGWKSVRGIWRKIARRQQFLSRR